MKEKKSYTIYQTMNMNVTWSTTQKGEKAVLHNKYLYSLKRQNKNGSSIYSCTSKSCYCSIVLKNNLIIKTNGETHNHDPKLAENVQTYAGKKEIYRRSRFRYLPENFTSCFTSIYSYYQRCKRQ